MTDMTIKSEIKEELNDLDKRMELERKKLDGSRLGLVDLITEKFVSRKLLVWVTSTILLGMGSITPDEWTAIALGYIGIEGVADIAAKWKFAGKKE
jgi:hypothetical protein